MKGVGIMLEMLKEEEKTNNQNYRFIIFIIHNAECVRRKGKDKERKTKMKSNIRHKLFS